MVQLSGLGGTASSMQEAFSARVPTAGLQQDGVDACL
jgi:hypothetical protein